MLTGNIDDLLSNGDERGAADVIDLAGNWMHEQQRLLLQYADRFTDPEILFDLIISVYTNDGYNFPKQLIQRAKRLARQIPADHRLQGLPAGDVLTIYRGTMVCNPAAASSLRTAISWTTDKTMAIWFANRMNNPHSPNGKGMVWEGTIKRENIIAFTQARHESEVLQHMNVTAPHMLDVDPAEWDAALQEQARQREQQQRELWQGMEG